MNADQSISRDIADIQSLDQVPMILDVCARVTGMRFTAVARVTDTKWITCASVDHSAFGLTPGDEIDLDRTLCAAVRKGRTLVAVDDVEREPGFDRDGASRLYGYRSGVSVPIFRGDGTFFGTLCAIDPEPRVLSDGGIVPMFRLFAEMIANALDARDHLKEERDGAALREEFIGVVGHDLRNPIAALSAGVRIIERTGTASPELATEMRRAIDRSFKIIDNLMDLTRGRLGNGIDADLAPADLGEIVRNVADELRMVGQADIRLDVDLPPGIVCDAQRLGQLTSNLISNAVDHHRAGTPIEVEARADARQIRLAVSNQGEPIPPQERAKLFMPFHRGENGTQKGLGLGLYIASEIARAHRGRIDVTSDSDVTTFTFKMPIDPR